ncbi:hypothetical protein AcV5_001550 [Taiwanofungus camphoratus]|nr:hypothetical protein AcV5_001550 [Antrodia cinnamomea]
MRRSPPTALVPGRPLVALNLRLQFQGRAVLEDQRERAHILARRIRKTVQKRAVPGHARLDFEICHGYHYDTVVLRGAPLEMIVYFFRRRGGDVGQAVEAVADG